MKTSHLKSILILNLINILLNISQINALLEDEIKYDLLWLGKPQNPELFAAQNPGSLINFYTAHNENFKCIVPEVEIPDDGKKSITDTYMPVHSLIAPLYEKKLCSYRVESYWIYEVCHGQLIRQYHETKQSGKRVVPQEYFLGYFHANKQDNEYYEENGIKKTKVIWKYIEGKRVPTYSVQYTDGTLCAILDNKPRSTTVYYVCDENGNESIISFEETSSCTYEIVVSSKWLCMHPSFQLPKEENKRIKCYAADDRTPIKPKELLNAESEIEASKTMQNKIIITDRQGSEFIVKVRFADSTTADPADDEDDSENEPKQQLSNPQQQPSDVVKAKPVSEAQPHGSIDHNADRDVINSFLSGAHCLNGGTGWWKYEVCYGKHIKQYHDEEENGARTSITLGTWNEKSHLEWITKYPQKKPAKINERSLVTLYFGEGDFCEQVNKRRFVEVRLKCDKTKNRSAHSMSFYIIEPMVCEYVLVVESPLLCQLISESDDNGLLKSSLSENKQP